MDNPHRFLIFIPVIFLLAALMGLGYGKYLKPRKTVSNRTPSAVFTPPVSPAVTPQPLKWGVFAGGGVNEFINFKKTIPQPADYLPVFVHWGNQNQFPETLATHATLQNQTLVIYWEAMDYNSPNPSEDPRFGYNRILAGDWDDYLTSFAASAKKYGRPVILVPFEEMNGDWYPWSVTKNGNTPQQHQAAYRYLHRFFDHIPNVKFAWVINNDNVPDYIQNYPLNYYPGDDYVDYTGVNGFNFGDPWQSFSAVFSKSLTDLETLHRPIIIFSMASASGPQKAEWIRQAGAEITRHPQIIGWIWFNQNKEKDWRLWSDPDSQSAFQNDLLRP